MRMVVYRRLDEDLDAWHQANPCSPGNADEEKILERMDHVWPTLSDDQRATLKAEVAARFSGNK